jgi:sodium-dependent dicarboxylate transporter 2/3/5
MVVPVIIGMAFKSGVDPLEPALGATMGAGLGLMLPVSTPCNAIVYSSGQIPLRNMIVSGLLLNLVAVVVIIAAVHWLTPLVH